MTKKNFVLILAVIVLCSWGYKKYTLFGKVAQDDETNGTISLAFDRYGDLYPEFKIEDEQLLKNQAVLETLFVNSEPFKQKLFQMYSKKSDSFDTIQKSIVTEKAKKVNKILSTNNIKSITLIMVGYNNGYEDANKKLNVLKSKIEVFLSQKHKNSYVIKVFWDGRHNNALTGLSYATVTSYYAGLGLREFLSQVKCEEVVMISHSLGANVICETLFNQINKVTDYDSVSSYLSDLYKTNYYKTPSQKITAAIVAPAMPGLTFDDYTERTSHYEAKNDNYEFIVGWNKNDIVLNKVFGGYFKTHYGSTTLGCDTAEYISVKNRFNELGVPNRINILDFSKNGCKKHRKHDLLTYIKMKQYDELLEKIYLK